MIQACYQALHLVYQDVYLRPNLSRQHIVIAWQISTAHNILRQCPTTYKSDTVYNVRSDWGTLQLHKAYRRSVKQVKIAAAKCVSKN